MKASRAQVESASPVAGGEIRPGGQIAAGPSSCPVIFAGKTARRTDLKSAVQRRGSLSGSDGHFKQHNRGSSRSTSIALPMAHNVRPKRPGTVACAGGCHGTSVEQHQLCGAPAICGLVLSQHNRGHQQRQAGRVSGQIAQGHAETSARPSTRSRPLIRGRPAARERSARSSGQGISGKVRMVVYRGNQLRRRKRRSTWRLRAAFLLPSSWPSPRWLATPGKCADGGGSARRRISADRSPPTGPAAPVAAPPRPSAAKGQNRYGVSQPSSVPSLPAAARTAANRRRLQVRWQRRSLASVRGHATGHCVAAP